MKRTSLAVLFLWSIGAGVGVAHEPDGVRFALSPSGDRMDTQGLGAFPLGGLHDYRVTPGMGLRIEAPAMAPTAVPLSFDPHVSLHVAQRTQSDVGVPLDVDHAMPMPSMPVQR